MGGRYRIVRQLGIGGFSQTFLAEDTQLPSYPRCVVKQLKPQMRNLERWAIAKRLFGTEAEVLYQLGHHDQIPRLFAHFEEHQEFYLVQELVEGESLQELLVPEQPWTEQRVIVLLRDILQILVFVHEQNVIHRDIKPSNIICRKQDGRAILIDFGAVKQVTAPMPDTTERQLMTISIGTQGYVPTEQLSGIPRFNSDIYAVGIIGIQILTGIRPHLLEREVQTNEIAWRAAKTGSLETDSLDTDSLDTDSLETAATQVSPELATILDRMVRYHFRDRYQTAIEPLQALEELLQQRDNIEPTVEFAGIASEAAIAWERIERSFEQASFAPTVMPPAMPPAIPPAMPQAKPAIAVPIDSETPIAPTSFEMAPELLTVETDIVAKSAEMAPELMTARTDIGANVVSIVAKPAEKDLVVAQPPLLQVIPQIRSVVSASFLACFQKLHPHSWWHSKVWRMSIIGGLGITAIATLTYQLNLLKVLNLPRATQVTPTVSPTVTPISLPSLLCGEPSPPTLPSKEWDYEYPNGTRYYGPMKEGRPIDGQVIMVFPSGNRYDGEIRGGKRMGCGTYTFASGKRYIGQFKNDRFEGQGMWILQNGDRYIGTFQNNQCQGQGVFIFANGSSKRGMWQDGNLIDGDLSCNR